MDDEIVLDIVFHDEFYQQHLNFLSFVDSEFLQQLYDQLFDVLQLENKNKNKQTKGEFGEQKRILDKKGNDDYHMIILLTFNFTK